MYGHVLHLFCFCKMYENLIKIYFFFKINYNENTANKFRSIQKEKKKICNCVNLCHVPNVSELDIDWDRSLNGAGMKFRSHDLWIALLPFWRNRQKKLQLASKIIEDDVILVEMVFFIDRRNFVVLIYVEKFNWISYQSLNVDTPLSTIKMLAHVGQKNITLSPPPLWPPRYFFVSVVVVGVNYLLALTFFKIAILFFTAACTN